MKQRHSVQHILRMLAKAELRDVTYQRLNKTPVGFIPASLNRRTLQPHEHAREIARTLNRKGHTNGI